MSVARVWEVLCDYEYDDGRQCEESFGVSTLDEVRRVAEVVGWRVAQPGGQDFCPEHQP